MKELRELVSYYSLTGDINLPSQEVYAIGSVVIENDTNREAWVLVGSGLPRVPGHRRRLLPGEELKFLDVPTNCGNHRKWEEVKKVDPRRPDEPLLYTGVFGDGVLRRNKPKLSYLPENDGTKSELGDVPKFEFHRGARIYCQGDEDGDV